jgi:hypothetical protein
VGFQPIEDGAGDLRNAKDVAQLTHVGFRR